MVVLQFLHDLWTHFEISPSGFFVSKQNGLKKHPPPLNVQDGVWWHHLGRVESSTKGHFFESFRSKFCMLNFYLKMLVTCGNWLLKPSFSWEDLRKFDFHVFFQFQTTKQWISECFIFFLLQMIFDAQLGMFASNLAANLSQSSCPNSLLATPLWTSASTTPKGTQRAGHFGPLGHSPPPKTMP